MKSPIILQEMMLWARSSVRSFIRQGRMFRRLLAEYDSNQWLSTEELTTLQLSKLRELLAHAKATVPYYMSALRYMTPESISIREIQGIPILEKATLRADPHLFLSKELPAIRFKASTSGTTGTPLTGVRDLTAVNAENAFLWRQLRWAGCRVGDRRAWLRGDTIVPLGDKHSPYWRFDRADNMLMFSSYHLQETTVACFVDALERFNPRIIQAYPASIAFIARYLDSRNRQYRGSALSGIVTSSETLYPEQRRIISKAFQCPVYDWYGQFERVAAIGTCEQGNYHIISDYGYCELLEQSDGSAQIVGTGFYNLLMPLIRYRTVDAVIPASSGYRCPCGRSFPVVEKILGREDDQLRTGDGRNHVAIDFIFSDIISIVEAQIIQDEIDHITIKVVPEKSFGQRDARVLTSRAQERLGQDMRVTIETVEAIPRGRNNKFRGSICNVH
jgi:phenylacetate-CoA ligase